MYAGEFSTHYVALNNSDCRKAIQGIREVLNLLETNEPARKGESDSIRAVLSTMERSLLGFLLGEHIVTWSI